MWPILIFTDNRDHCDYLKDTISAVDRRIRAESSSDTNELVALLRQHRPLLVVASTEPAMIALRASAMLREVDRSVPILVEIATDRPLESLQAMTVGVTDYVKRPVLPWEWQHRCRLLLESARERLALGGMLHRVRRHHPRHFREHEVLAHAGAVHDAATGAHERRTGLIAGIVAHALALPDTQCRHVERGAALHDIGKIGIPDEVLRRPGRYSNDDRRIMQAHPQIGYEIMKHGTSEYLRTGAEIALTHHERFDGSGYPNGLAGDAIPIAGRITAVADVFDALTDGRTYHRSVSPDDALDYLRRHRGTLFDPDCVDAVRMELDHIVATVDIPPLQ